MIIKIMPNVEVSNAMDSFLTESENVNVVHVANEAARKNPLSYTNPLVGQLKVIQDDIGDNNGGVIWHLVGSDVTLDASWIGVPYTKNQSGGYVMLTTPQVLTQLQKDQLAENWEEAVLYPKFDKIVVDGDSRSTGVGVGSWPTLLGEIKPFDQTTITSVAVSGHQAHTRLAAFDTDVLPLAPATGEKALYILYIGVNDVFQVGGENYSNTRDIYETIKQIWTKARDAGFEVCAVTLQDADHDTGFGIEYREERQEILNRMILAGSDHYDFLIPLHELIPDHTVFTLDALHLNVAGNEFIAEQVAKILGAKDRTKNTPVQGRGLSELEYNYLPSSINTGRYIWPEYNLALTTDTTTASGTVTNILGYKRLTSASSTGSVAAIRVGWPLLNTGNNINWGTTSRYRGVVVDFDRANLQPEHVFRVSIGNLSATFNVAGFGFEYRNNGGTFEMRAIATDSSLVVNNSSWVDVSLNTNFQVVAFAKGSNVSVFYTSSNGGGIYEVWTEITTTGAPTGAGGGGNVCAALEATGSPPANSSIIDVRSIRPFESETLPLSPTKFVYH